jgi:hypothetical protein
VTGSCHCRQNSITINRPPTFLYSCNCSLCMKSGGLWAYFAGDDVSFSGTTTSYRRNDKAESKGRLHFCNHCGSTTHWMSDSDAGAWTCAVNMRLFEPGLLAGVAVHYPDGAHWSGSGPFEFFRDPAPHDGISH